MTSDVCRDLRGTLGAAALGRISAAEEIALRAHLDGCPSCRAELDDLRAIAAALALADPSRVVGDLPEPPSLLGDLVVRRVTQERRARRARLRRRSAFGAAAAALAAAVIALVIVVSSSSSTGTRVVFHTRRGVVASATLRGHDTGTEVAFRVGGLDTGKYYWLWLTGDDGDRIAAGTFQGSPRAVVHTMTAALPLDEARRIWVTDSANDVVLDAWLPRAT